MFLGCQRASFVRFCSAAFNVCCRYFLFRFDQLWGEPARELQRRPEVVDLLQHVPCDGYLVRQSDLARHQCVKPILVFSWPNVSRPDVLTLTIPAQSGMLVRVDQCLPEVRLAFFW